MATFTIEIDDSLVDGITAALAQHNAGKEPADQLAGLHEVAAHLIAVLVELPLQRAGLEALHDLARVLAETLRHRSHA